MFIKRREISAMLLNGVEIDLEFLIASDLM